MFKQGGPGRTHISSLTNLARARTHTYTLPTVYGSGIFLH